MNKQTENEQEITVEAQEIIIAEQPIELYKVLKMANMVNSGGQAKMLIADGFVAVNGELEYQKRKKIYAEDVIEFNGEFLYVLCDQAATAPANPAKSKADKKSKTSHKNKKKAARSSIKF